jgi:FtsH-binding integral membrane protein
MNNYYGNSWSGTTADGRSLSLTTVNSFLKQVLGYMAIGLAITGLVAYLLGQQLIADAEILRTTGDLPAGLLKTMMSNQILMYALMFAPFIFVLVLSMGINRLSFPVAAVLFAAFAGVMGVSLSFIFMVYTGASIALTFFVTAGMFAVMAIIALTTKIDLTKYSSYFTMAIIGLVIMSLVNMFMKSSGMYYLIGGAGVIIFSGLIALNIQQVVQTSGLVEGDSEQGKKAGLLGALSLYMSFINLFLMLLRFLGSSRD